MACPTMTFESWLKPLHVVEGVGALIRFGWGSRRPQDALPGVLAMGGDSPPVVKCFAGL